VELSSFTIVIFKDGHTSYIKEFFTKEEAMSKEDLDITLVYLIIPSNGNMNNIVAFEDEKKTIKASEIRAMRKIVLNLSQNI